MNLSTLNIEIVQFGTTGVKTEWGIPAEARVMASVMLGIEQLKKGQGTYLTDADLTSPDDDD